MYSYNCDIHLLISSAIKIPSLTNYPLFQKVFHVSNHQNLTTEKDLQRTRTVNTIVYICSPFTRFRINPQHMDVYDSPISNLTRKANILILIKDYCIIDHDEQTYDNEQTLEEISSCDI